MRQTYLAFIVLFLFANFQSSAQTSTTSPQIIKYDLSTNQFSGNVGPIKEGSQVSIQYLNVNKYALKSSSTLTSGNRTYEDGLTQLQAGLLQLAGEKKEVKQETEKTTDEKNDNKNMIPAAAEVLDDYTRYLKAKEDKLSDIEDEFVKISTEVSNVNSIMSVDKDIIAATDDPTLYNAALMNGAVFIQSGTTGISKPTEFSSTLKTSMNNIYGSIVKARAAIRALKNNLEDLKSSLNESKDKLAVAKLKPAQRKEQEQRLKEQEERIKEEEKKLNDLTTELEKRISAVETTYTGNNLKTLQDNAADMARRSNKLISQDFNIAPTSIGYADGDYIEISDKLTDNAGKQILEIKPFKINTYGGARVDFSIGLSVNIGGHGQYKYDLRKNPTNATSGTAKDSVILLYDNEDNLFTFSPAIFVHWYKVSTKNLQWMLTTGLTPDFTDLDNSRLSIGTGLGFPSTNNLTRRLVISAGLSFGYADVLKTKYKNMVDYREFGDLDAADLTDKAIKVGAFFAVSYNLGGTNHK